MADEIEISKCSQIFVYNDKAGSRGTKILIDNNNNNNNLFALVYNIAFNFLRKIFNK